jgi:guanylate kinase
MPPGQMFILSAPSGTGKSTLIRSLMSGEANGVRGLVFAVSHTTRAPRRGEVDGKDYHFVDHDTFQRMIDEGRFLEHAEYGHHHYGTSSDEVLPRLARGTDVILEIEVQGAEQVRSRHPEAVSIFVMPPSFEALRQRLEARNLDGPEAVRHRLALSLREMKRYREYDFVIINDEAARASQALAAILLAGRHRREGVEERAEAILRSFEEAFQRDPEGEPVEVSNPPASRQIRSLP